MTRYYCTLFDSGYLSRGLALYDSLLSKSSMPIFLHILAMDEDCYRALSKLNLKHAKVIHLENDFLNQDLRTAKSNRSWAEFCWTSSSGLIKYLFEKEKLSQVTYLDSDIYFFRDPEILFKQFDERGSALITDHHYFKKHDQSASSGRFCVQFVPFNNNEAGNAVLDRWYRQCLNDCSLSPERGVCGDQKYLDEWPQLYPHVKICSNKGAGVAPWNVEEFRFSMGSTGAVQVQDGGSTYPLVFYHFHGLKFFDSNRVELSGERYKIGRFIFRNVYEPYFQALGRVAIDVARVGEPASHAIQKDKNQHFGLSRTIFSFVTGNFNRMPSFTHVSFQLCPVCKSEDVGLRRSGLYDDRYGYPGYFNLASCQSCEHQFLLNRFKAGDFSELYTKYYPRATLSLDSFLPSKLVGGWKGWLLGERCAAFAWVPEKVRVLDVGCGFGQSVAYHAARGSHAVGVDADENAKRVADKFNLDIRIGVFKLEMFANEKFNFIILDQVLEHSQDPVKFLGDLTQLLDPEGRIVVSIPNANGLGARIFGRKWIHWHTPYHLQFYSDVSLRKLVNSVGGLQIERCEYVSHTHWSFYQLLAVLTFPKMGYKSKFWADERFSLFQRVIRKACGAALKLGVFAVYTRLLDLLRLGDNKIIILKKSR